MGMREQLLSCYVITEWYNYNHDKLVTVTLFKEYVLLTIRVLGKFQERSQAGVLYRLSLGRDFGYSLGLWKFKQVFKVSNRKSIVKKTRVAVFPVQYLFPRRAFQCPTHS